MSENVRLLQQLALERCPSCSIARPQLISRFETQTKDYSNSVERYWVVYQCFTCGGLITAWSSRRGDVVFETYPRAQHLDESIPFAPSEYLRQAMESIHAPSGAVMLAASAIDAMLKEKNYTKGSLYARISKAAQDHLITEEMAAWAHDVRLDANDQRHADATALLPTENDARRCVEFARALAEFLFVLPARVRRGRQEAAGNQNS